MVRTLPRVLLCFFVLVAAGCGGGGSAPSDDPIGDPPANGPFAFATGERTETVVVGDDGFLNEEVVLLTAEGIRLRLRRGTEIRDRTPEGRRIAGPVEIGIDGEGPTTRPNGGQPLSGVVRVTVREAGTLRSVWFEPPAEVKLELYDGTRDGHWELLGYAQDGAYVTGAGDGELDPSEELVEVHRGLVLPRGDGREELDVRGTGPVGFLFVPHGGVGSAKTASPPGLDVTPTLQDVVFDLNDAPEELDFLHEAGGGDVESGPLVAWFATGATKHWMDLPSLVFTSALGEEWILIWGGPGAGAPAREIVLRSKFRNHLRIKARLGHASGALPGEWFERKGVGGVSEADDLDGPFAGPVQVKLIGRDFSDDIFGELAQLEAVLPVEAVPVVESLTVWGGKLFRAEIRLQRHYASVHALAEQLPDDWAIESKARRLEIDAGGLLFDFEIKEEGTQGWVLGHGSRPLDSAVRHSSGAIKLDGSDLGESEPLPVPNAWMARVLELPEDVTTLAIRLSAHDLSNSDVQFRVLVGDHESSTTHTVHDWDLVVHPGGGFKHYVNRVIDMSAFAGKSITLIIQQDDDGEGANEQLWVDEVALY